MATLKELSERTGYSTATISRVLNADATLSVPEEVRRKILEEAEAGCPEGTTIIVRDLFFNTPARMKFMKSDTVEGSRVAAAVQQQALAHPEVAFQFLRDGKQVLSTPGTGGLEAAAYCVYGRDAGKLFSDRLRIQAHRCPSQPCFADLLRQQPSGKIQAADFCFGRSLPESDHGGQIPRLCAASECTCRFRGCKRSSCQDGSEVPVGKGSL